jgi:DNA-binding winged helix-turn-helix (wHTH) protein
VFDHGTVDLDARRFERSEGGAPLTMREVDLLRYLHGARGRPVSREELLREVWGSAAGVDGRMVEGAIRRLRAKIERDPTDARILVEVWGEGYRLNLPSAPEAPTPTSALPRPRSALLGREPIVHRVAEELARTGFVALVGPPGIGKTRVAVEFARRTDPDAAFVSLSGATTPAEVRHLVASAIGARATGGWDLDELLIERLAGRLLVLDDVDVAVGGTLTGWLRSPGLRIVVTRPVPLAARDEVAMEVPPLDLESGVALYESCAAAAGRRPSPAEAPYVAALVRRLDGNPLAIELAASWAAVLDPIQVQEVVEDAAQIEPDAYPLVAVIRGAWQMSTAEDQDVLLACSLFPSSFDPSWVAAVADAPARVPAALLGLRKRGLLVPAGRRFEMPAAVRMLVEEELEARGDAPRMARFAEWCRQEAWRLGEELVEAAEPRDLERDLGALVAAAHVVADADAFAEVVLALGPALELAGWHAVARSYVELAVGQVPHPSYLAALAERAAAAALALGEEEEAAAAIEDAELRSATGADDVLRAEIALDRAGLAGLRGEGEQVLAYTRMAADVLRTKEGLDAWRAVGAWLAVGANLLAARDQAGAEGAFVEALRHARAAESHRRAAVACTRLAGLALDRGEPSLASSRVGEAESELRVVGARATPALLRVRGALAELRGDFRLAESDWREVALQAAASAEVWIEHEARLALGRCAFRRGGDEEARSLLVAAAAFARGRWPAGFGEAAALLALIAHRRGERSEVERIRYDLEATGAGEPARFVRALLEGEALAPPPEAPLPLRLRYELAAMSTGTG